MSQQFSRTLKVVTGLHVGIVLMLLFHSGIVRLFEPKPEMIIPVEFVVDVTPPMPDVNELLPPVAEPEPEPEPEPPAIIPEPTPAPPKPKPHKKIEVSRKKITRSNAPKKPKRNTLTEEEIRKLLAAGAKPSDHTSIPDEDQRCMALIRNTLHAVWDEPTAEAAGSAETELRITLDPGGHIRSSKLHRRSGNVALDSSVQRVADSVQRIHGLSADFIRRHPTVTISFSVTGQSSTRID
jgi:outer membrane biosynthesis protein TonB